MNYRRIILRRILRKTPSPSAEETQSAFDVSRLRKQICYSRSHNHSRILHSLSISRIFLAAQPRNKRVTLILGISTEIEDSRLISRIVNA